MNVHLVNPSDKCFGTRGGHENRFLNPPVTAMDNKIREAKNSGSPAELFVNAGVHYVALDFIAIKEADGDLRRMADQVRRGIAWVYENAGSFGGDQDGLYVGGFSSGGHLCGVSLVTDWQKDFGLPPNFIKRRLVHERDVRPEASTAFEAQ